MSHLSALQESICENLPPEYVDQALRDIKMTLADSEWHAWVDSVIVVVKIRDRIVGVDADSCDKRAAIQGIIDAINDAKPGMLGD